MEHERHSSVVVNDQFELHILRGYIQTIYLAVYPDKILVLDSGCACDAAVVVKYVKQTLHRSVENVRLAVASHAHPDHMGGAQSLRDDHGIELAAPPLINSWYEGLGGSVQHKVDTLLAQYVASMLRRKRRRISYRRRLVFDHELTDGGALPHFEDWMSIDTPGHTNHDVVLFNENASMLYMADVIINVNHHFMLPLPVALNRQLGCSFEKLKSLRVKHLVLAHRGVHRVEDFGVLMDTLQAQLRQNGPTNVRMRMALALQSFSPALRRARKAG